MKAFALNTRLLSCAALLLVFAWFAEAAGVAQNLIYVVDYNNQFGTVDLSTGAFTQIGAPTPEPLGGLVWVHGSLLSLSVFGNLDKIDPLTGNVTVIGQTGLGSNANQLATLDGRLYATDVSNNLYAVDPGTGVATLIGATGIPPVTHAPFTFNADGTLNLFDESLYASGGKLYATFDAFKVDPITLAVTPWVNAALYEIDPSTGEAKLIGPTLLGMGGAVVAHGKFYGIESAIVGFDQYGNPLVQDQLYAIDLSSGAVEFVKNLDSGEGAIFGAAPVRVEYP